MPAGAITHAFELLHLPPDTPGDAARGAELVDVPVSAVRVWGRDGTLPRVKLGRHVRFIRAHVETAILDAERTPTDRHRAVRTKTGTCVRDRNIRPRTVRAPACSCGVVDPVEVCPKVDRLCRHEAHHRAVSRWHSIRRLALERIRFDHQAKSGDGVGFGYKRRTS